MVKIFRGAKTRMRRQGWISAFVLVGGGILAAGCTSTTTPSNSPNVTMQSQFSATKVTPTATKGEHQITDFKGSFVDSLEVTSARIFVRDIKMHHSEDDSLIDEKDEEIKLGPFVFTFDAAGARVVTSAVIPPGNYDRIKFEMHKYDADKDKDGYDKGDTAVNEFISGDGYTFLISGFVWKGGVRSPFVYASKVTVNLNLRFPQDVVLGSDAVSTLLLQLDPWIMFHVTGFAVDPRDDANRHIIDDAIKSSFKLFKHL